MTVHYLQHVAFEGLGAIEDWCASRGHAVEATRLFAEPLPASLEVDLLVVLGGPMNVYQEDTYPWLAAEKEFLAQAIEGGTRVLGVCLGAQLLADVLGGSVSPNVEREIGWYPVELEPEAAMVPGFDRLPSRFAALHWHGDTFSVPPGALRLAESQACPNQAFSWNEGQVVALQFHLEETRDSLRLLVEHAAHELAPAAQVPGSVAPSWISSAEELLSHEAPLESCRKLLFELLDGMMGA